MQPNVFFISFKESNCEQNWSRVLELHPDAIRLHGVKGIDVVHNTCDQLCSTDYFWTIDGDNYLTSPLRWNRPIHHDLLMFKALDPIHGNLTLLGGVKLWRKNSIINKTMSKGDFCLNATQSKGVIDHYYSETRYNSSPYDTWKTAFRHCVKLLSVIFRSRPNAKDIDQYVDAWKSCAERSTLNAVWGYRGYLDAAQYVAEFDNNLEKLYMINNYEWLAQYFTERYSNEV